VQANEAPAHGFSGGHLLLKEYSKNGIRLLFDAYGLGFLWNKEGVKFDTYCVVLALIPATGATAKPYTISTNELNVDHSQ
jgi:hypothetical protein